MRNICPICGSDKRSIVYEKISNLARCDVCGHVYVRVPYSTEFYNEDYFTRGCDGAGTWNFLGELYKLYDEARFSQEIKRIRRFKKTGKILDIGCAMGNFMKMIYQEGFDPYGMDISPSAVNYCNNNHDVPVFVGPLSEVHFDKGMFDLITMHHVFEDIPNPTELLEFEVRPILKDDGLLIVEVPNFLCFESRINKEEWEDLRLSQHINQFTPKSLKWCLERAGFLAETIVTYSPHTHSLLWRYPKLLSFIGLSEGVIKRMANRLKPYFKNRSNRHERAMGIIGEKSFLDTFTRYMVKPLDLLYSHLGLGKYVAMCARPVKTKLSDER